MITSPTRIRSLLPALMLMLAVGALSSMPLAAQQPETSTSPAQPLRDGFHFALGLGGASVSATCPGCDVSFIEDRISGFSGLIQMGGALSDRLVVAAQFSGWIKNDEILYRRLASLSVVLLGYPSSTSGFFVKGGFGGLAAVVETDFDYAETRAFSSETGVGIDIPISGSASISPYVSYVRTFVAASYVDGFEIPFAVTPNVIQFGAALVVH